MQVPFGEPVVLTASTTDVEWNVCALGANPVECLLTVCTPGPNPAECRLTATEDVVVTARLGPSPAISVSVTGPGTVTELGGTINCREAGGDCHEDFPDAGSEAYTLTATPDATTDASLAFLGWSGAG